MLLIEPLSFRAQRGISFRLNESYRNLLLSEALYKTGNLQYYRDDLQTAMRFFDSLAVQYPANDDAVFYSARSHYMNGVGYYETDSVVAACKEYLLTLEIMENHFDVEKLTDYKAKFMGLTYGRLKEFFFSQFMVEPAIYCEKKALYFCRISPTSKYGISKNLAKLGQLYDMLNIMDSAYYYYNEAISSLPDTNNLIYRDVISSRALISYKLGHGLQPSLKRILSVAIQAESEGELLARYYTIGGLYYEEKLYDSAAIYLNRVFQNDKNNMRRLQAADFLMNIYKLSNDTLITKEFIDYLAQNAVSKYENSFDVSTLNELYHIHMNKKSYALQKKNIIKTIVIFSLFVLIASVAFAFILIRRSRKLKKEHRRAIYTERKAHYREKNKMLDTIKQHETKVNALEHELGQKRLESDERMEAFLNEPVCKRIKSMVKTIGISPRINCADYSQMKLDQETIAILEETIEKYFHNYKHNILSLNPRLNNSDMLLCNLYLLGLNNNQISVLTQTHYSTIFRKTKKLEETLENGATLSEFLHKTAVL